MVAYWSWSSKWLPKENVVNIKPLHETCGETMTPTLICSHCGETVRPHDVKYKVGSCGKDLDLR